MIISLKFISETFNKLLKIFQALFVKKMLYCINRLVKVNQKSFSMKKILIFNVLTLHVYEK